MSMLKLWRNPKVCCLLKSYLFIKQQNLHWTKLKALADDKLNVSKMMIHVLIGWKTLMGGMLISTMFQKDFFSRVIKRQVYLEKGKNI